MRRVRTGEPLEPVQQLVDPRVILTLAGLLRPLSRGWVRLTSADPTVYTEIFPNYGGEQADVDRIVTMVKIAREVYAAQAFK